MQEIQHSMEKTDIQAIGLAGGTTKVFLGSFYASK